MSELLDSCRDLYPGCPAVLLIEKRLDRIDEAMEKIVNLMTGQAVQASQLEAMQHSLSDHSTALSAGRDRFNVMDLRMAELSNTCSTFSTMRRWLYTTGIASLIAMGSLALNLHKTI